MSPQAIHGVATDRAPAAVGPYAQGVSWDRLVFASGQLPINPATGNIEATTAADQADQAITNLRNVLAAAGTGLDSVVKTTVFLADLADFAAVNQVYARHFADDPKPARSTFQVAGLPMSALVEIEAIAVRCD